MPPLSPVVVNQPLATAGALAAILTTALTGTNNDLTARAKARGTGGNSLSLQLDISGAYPAVQVQVTGNAVRINGPTGTTALEAIAAFNQTPAAVKLMSLETALSNNGSGALVSLAATNLAGGAGELPDAPPAINS